MPFNIIIGLGSKKYRLDASDCVETSQGNRLFRVVALRDFGDVKKGERGGYIESERNLSHWGRCWVADDARVYERGLVCRNGQVSGKARVRGEACVLGSAHVGENAELSDSAMAFGRSRIYGAARLFGSIWLSGKARAFGAAALFEDWWITKGDLTGDSASENAQEYMYPRQNLI
jgi:hypothetical protein